MMQLARKKGGKNNEFIWYIYMIYDFSFIRISYWFLSLVVYKTLKNIRIWISTVRKVAWKREENWDCRLKITKVVALKIQKPMGSPRATWNKRSYTLRCVSLTRPPPRGALVTKFRIHSKSVPSVQNSTSCAPPSLIMDFFPMQIGK